MDEKEKWGGSGGQGKDEQESKHAKTTPSERGKGVRSLKEQTIKSASPSKTRQTESRRLTT